MNNARTYHLCLTQSPLITLVFQAAMKELKVPAELVRSISRRAVNPAGPGICLDGLSDELEARYKGFDRSGYLECKSQLLHQVGEVTDGGKFLAYLPHTQRLMYQEILKHPQCAGYLFIEEGFTSMAWESRQNVKLSWRWRLLHALRKRWTGSHFNPARDMFDTGNPGFRGAISISDNAFTGMPGVRNISQWIPRFKCHGGPRKVYVILDTSYLHRGIRWQDYEDALVEAILNESANASDILVKFHFADSRASARFTSLHQRVTAGGGRLLTWLDRDFSVEDQLTADDCLLFGVSSLGYYTAMFGGNAKCFAPMVKGLELNEWIGKGLLPVDFFTVVGLPRPSPQC